MFGEPNRGPDIDSIEYLAEMGAARQPPFSLHSSGNQCLKVPAAPTARMDKAKKSQTFAYS
jgi:hypothetical protein